MLEEPPRGSVVVLLAESEAEVIDTLLGRCYKLYFDPYSSEFLSTFVTGDASLYRFCSTPGQIKQLAEESVESIYKLAELLVDKLQAASIPNTLTVLDKIRWKDEKDRLPLRPLLRMVQGLCWEKLQQSSESLPYHQLMLSCIGDLITDLMIPNLDAKLRFEHFLLQMKLNGDNGG